MAWLVKLPVFHFLMKWGIRLVVPRHRVGVVLVIMDETNRVLLLNHVFHPFESWGLPGGWLDRKESPAEGVLRELKEETGLTAVIDDIIQIDRQPRPSHLGVVYLGRIIGGTLRLSPEIIEAQWFPADALPDAMQDFHRQAIDTAVTRRCQGANTQP